MRALCRFIDSASLADHQRGRFASIVEQYDLSVGELYAVLGMGIWETVLQVLVRNDWGLPVWCPAALFEIEDQPLPDHWRFALRSDVQASGRDLWTRWVAQWGYPELIVDERHSDALMERDAAALEIFSREIERFGASEAEGEA
jgi:hypothetical protein